MGNKRTVKLKKKKKKKGRAVGKCRRGNRKWCLIPEGERLRGVRGDSASIKLQR